MAQAPSLSSALKKLHQTITLDKKDVSLVYFFAIIGGLISLTLPLGIQTIINFVMANTLSTTIIILIAIVILGVFLNGFIQIRQLQVIERMKQKIFSRYTLEFSYKIPKINLALMDNYYLPEVVNRYFEITSLTKSIEKLLVDIPTSIIQIVLGLILLSFYHPLFIAFGAFVLLVLVIIIRLTSPKGFKTSMLASDYKFAIGGWLEEIARGSKTFRYSKGSELHMRKSDYYSTSYLDSRTSHFKVLLVQFWSLISFKITIIGIMLIAGTWLLLNQQINVGQFIASDIVIILILGSVEKLISSMDTVYDSLTSIEKLSKIVDIETEETGHLPFNKEPGCSIEFKNVSYTYPDGSIGIKDAQFKVANKSIVAITGLSGAGKSTILRLLTGAFQSYEGNILLNSIPLGNFKLNELRLNTGIMLNDQDIFRGTILENLTMGNENITLEEITYLSNLMGLNEYLNSTKKGFDTILDPTGKRLSQQVIQSIKLMRALLGKPTLLLLEEPLTHLDSKHKTNLLQYLKNESNATIMIVTNDEDIIAASNQVLTLVENNIV